MHCHARSAAQIVAGVQQRMATQVQLSDQDHQARVCRDGSLCILKIKAFRLCPRDHLHAAIICGMKFSVVQRPEFLAACCRHESHIESKHLNHASIKTCYCRNIYDLGAIQCLPCVSYLQHWRPRHTPWTGPLAQGQCRPSFHPRCFASPDGGHQAPVRVGRRR